MSASAREPGWRTFDCDGETRCPQRSAGTNGSEDCGIVRLIHSSYIIFAYHPGAKPDTSASRPTYGDSQLTPEALVVYEGPWEIQGLVE